MNLAIDYFNKNNFSEENNQNFSKNFEQEGKLLFFDRVFRRHHVLNDPVNLIDPEGKSPLMGYAFMFGFTIGAVSEYYIQMKINPGISKKDLFTSMIMAGIFTGGGAAFAMLPTTAVPAAIKLLTAISAEIVGFSINAFNSSNSSIIDLQDIKNGVNKIKNSTGAPCP